MGKYLVSLFWILLSFPSLAKELPDHWVTVGQSKLKVYWFSIYSAELRTPDGIYSEDEIPLLLTLNYHRTISRNDLLSETRKELQRFLTVKQITDLIAQLSNIWPDVREGDQLAFLLDTQGEGFFFFNGQLIGVLPDVDQSQAFVKIWLSNKSRYPMLAKKLRGEFNEIRSD